MTHSPSFPVLPLQNSLPIDQLRIDRAQRLGACSPDPVLELAEETGASGGEGEIARLGHAFRPKEHPGRILYGVAAGGL
jgi:hypothetical protein